MRHQLAFLFLAATMIACGGRSPDEESKTTPPESQSPTHVLPGTPTGGEADLAAIKPSEDFHETPEYAELLGTFDFQNPRVGRDQQVSKHAEAFATLLARPDAKESMTALWEAKNTPFAGKLYGLCGLYFTDKVAFDKGVASLRHSQAKIGFVRGDLYLSDYPVGDIVWSDEPNTAIITDPEKAFAQWNALMARVDGDYTLDIAHGGFPTALRAAGGGGWK